MQELWTGQVELLTPPSGKGDTSCFINAVAWADGRESFAAAVEAVFSGYGWSILRIEGCKRVADYGVMVKKLAEQSDRASENPMACIFGTLHYYPSRLL